MIEYAMSIPKNEYKKIRRYALLDNYLMLCFNDGMSVEKINLCEYMREEIATHGKLISFPFR